MRVTANGAATELPTGANLADLLGALGLGQRWVVAELNGEPVARGAMASTALTEGDRIELVRAVAGG